MFSVKLVEYGPLPGNHQVTQHHKGYDGNGRKRQYCQDARVDGRGAYVYFADQIA